jgi:hypothetical protein
MNNGIPFNQVVLLQSTLITGQCNEMWIVKKFCHGSFSYAVNFEITYAATY